jgi:hypothetical protein
MRIAVASVASLVLLSFAAPVWAQNPPSIGATPRIVFAAPGTNPFLDQSRRHADGPIAQVPRSSAQRHTGDDAWQVVHIAPAPKGPRTNDCQMPVIIGNTTTDPLFNKTTATSPNPMAKVAVPCHAKKQ